MAKTKIMISDEMNFNIFNNNTLFNWKNDDENEFSNKYEKDICNFTPFVGEETFTDDKNEKDFFKNCPNEIDSNLDADSSKNLSDEDKKESEELSLLPSNLFDSIKINPKDNNKEILDENISIVNKLNINSKPFIPKGKKLDEKISNRKKITLEKNTSHKNRYFNYDLKNINKKNLKNKKKKFCEKDGDWPCYICKNINYRFRNKCNKCGISKEESENQFIEAEKKLLKMFNLPLNINRV